ncbi:MAG TPA: J domain-containing protein, partial [Chlamydiales bacterium]|nr:J domain-containing protein [Chlamydiales bacterium]
MVEVARTQSKSFFESEFATSSFSTQSIQYLLSSNFFFPSNVKERQVDDLGSIRKSVDVCKIDIFKTKKVERSTFAKGGRCLARIVASAGISMVVAPIGLIWHSCSLSFHAILYCTNRKEKDYHYELISKAKFALLADGTLTFLGCICPLILFRLGLSYELLARIAIPATLVFPILLGFLPQQVPRLFFQEDLRVPFYKSILLKNTYGIVGQGGKLLSWDIKEDQENVKIVQGHFGEIFVQQALNYLSILQKLHNEGVELPKHYPPNTDAIIYCIRTSNISDTHKKCYIAQLQKCDANIKHLRKALERFIEMGENSIFHYYLGARCSVQIPQFPISESAYESLFTTIKSPDSGWDFALEHARDALKSFGGNNKKGFNQDYKDYKERVFTQKSPHGLLDLQKNYTPEQLRKAYLKCAIKLHPDKVPEAYKKEAEEVFKIYSTAYKIL